ncbi:MFS transporter [Leifsonia sp. 1010]|uniref:MFS transporter n=1 Tax=Leifsonia sp. 1010 TaxID=2817769 RepID=UPI002856598A|nr:MFS transporter [Leifsonia sp. 1010]MDR6611371.1 MFS family permease [Leifsonia sp. 1010]
MTSPSPSLFASRDFRLLLIGQTTSQLGAQVSGVALPLLAVVSLDATPFEVGMLGAASTVAFAVLGLPAGAWIDRMRRRPLLVASDLVRAVLLATIPLAAVFGLLTMGQLLVVSLLAGVARVFFDVGYRSYLPAVIGRERVLAGNSSLEFVRASGQVAGPALGGVLVSLIGAATVVLVQAGTFAVSALCLLGIRAREEEPTAPEHRRRMRTEIAEGLGFVFRSRVLRSTALASALSNFSFAIASAVNIVFLSRTLGLSPALIGIVIAVGSVTVMIGAAFTTRLSRAVGSVRIVWLSLAVTAPLSLLGAFAQPGWWTLLIVLGIAAGEFGQIVYAITQVSVRQQICPDRVLGRVNATMQVVVMGLFPVGAIVGGLLGDAIGARWTLIVAGMLLLACPVILWTSLRGVREVADLPAPADA